MIMILILLFSPVVLWTESKYCCKMTAFDKVWYPECYAMCAVNDVPNKKVIQVHNSPNTVVVASEEYTMPERSQRQTAPIAPFLQSDGMSHKKSHCSSCTNPRSVGPDFY